MTGHVFVLHGDLTKLLSDCVLVPVDRELNVSTHWRTLVSHLEPIPGPWGLQLTRVKRLKRSGVGHGGTTSDGRHVVLMATAESDATKLVDRVLKAISLARDGLDGSPAHQRAKHLIALPLPGVGSGGLAGRQGEVIKLLLPAAHDAAARLDVDLLLVLFDERDYVAVQAERTAVEPCDKALGEVERDLAAKAVSGSLVPFLGAGVSAAAGLPLWGELLQELAGGTGLDVEELSKLPAVDAAQAIARKRGATDFTQFIAERFTLDGYAPSHGFIANLQPAAAITTNYDNGYELAFRAMRLPQPLKVLTGQRAEGSSPWLLKMHGDANDAASIVLTREQYVDFGERASALAGVVQAQLLTKHVMFVGFSMIDDNFARLAHQVRRYVPIEDGEDAPVGTVVQLKPDPIRESLWQPELRHLAVHATEDVEAPRQLEIFLDRLAWQVARLRSGREAVLLDPDYEGFDWDPEDQRLRKALLELHPLVAETASPSAEAVRELLHRLGLSGARTTSGAGAVISDHQISQPDHA